MTDGAPPPAPDAEMKPSDGTQEPNKYMPDHLAAMYHRMGLLDKMRRAMLKQFAHTPDMFKPVLTTLEHEYLPSVLDSPVYKRISRKDRTYWLQRNFDKAHDQLLTSMQQRAKAWLVNDDDATRRAASNTTNMNNTQHQSEANGAQQNSNSSLPQQHDNDNDDDVAQASLTKVTAKHIGPVDLDFVLKDILYKLRHPETLKDWYGENDEDEDEDEDEVNNSVGEDGDDDGSDNEKAETKNPDEPTGSASTTTAAELVAESSQAANGAGPDVTSTATASVVDSEAVADAESSTPANATLQLTAFVPDDTSSEFVRVPHKPASIGADHTEGGLAAQPETIVIAEPALSSTQKGKRTKKKRSSAIRDDEEASDELVTSAEVAKHDEATPDNAQATENNNAATEKGNAVPTPTSKDEEKRVNKPELAPINTEVSSMAKTSTTAAPQTQSFDFESSLSPLTSVPSDEDDDNDDEQDKDKDSSESIKSVEPVVPVKRGRGRPPGSGKKRGSKTGAVKGSSSNKRARTSVGGTRGKGRWPKKQNRTKSVSPELGLDEDES
ncbi:hypothetical protein OIO90_005563 [Microbotryomycetes sp. JL221]|nr:hypothetical protein OIO90_005563 [Microbotryomycetes sp. JL221]